VLKFEKNTLIYEIMFDFNCRACYKRFEHHDELI